MAKRKKIECDGLNQLRVEPEGDAGTTYELEEVFEEPDDYIHCAACGQPFNDGGGLYCSARCEEIGNPGAD